MTASRVFFDTLSKGTYVGTYVAFLNELGLDDIADVGGKGANL